MLRAKSSGDSLIQTSESSDDLAYWSIVFHYELTCFKDRDLLYPFLPRHKKERKNASSGM